MNTYGGVGVSEDLDECHFGKIVEALMGGLAPRHLTHFFILLLHAHSEKQEDSD